MSLYTKEIAKAVRQVKKPYKNLKLSVSDCGDHLELLVFENNINSFSEAQKITCMEYLVIIESIVQSFGVNAFLAGVPAGESLV